MAHQAEKTHDIVDLSSIYDPAVMQDAYNNLGTIFGPKEQKGTWDDVYHSLAPFYQVTPQGFPVVGLHDPQTQVALPLSEIYKTLDGAGVAVSAIAAIARLIEEGLDWHSYVTNPLEILKERREQELKVLEDFAKYLKTVRDFKGYWESDPNKEDTEEIYGLVE